MGLSYPTDATDNLEHITGPPQQHTEPVFDFPWLAFQYRHAEGMVLNVGAGGDSARLKELRHAVNVDVCRTDPVSGLPNKIDRIADARDLPFPDKCFDTVVLGEVLEHLTPEGSRQAIQEARRVARQRIVITVPQDLRSVEHQRQERRLISGADPEPLEYAEGCSTYHRLTMLTEVVGWFYWCKPEDLYVEPMTFGKRLCYGVVAPV